MRQVIARIDDSLHARLKARAAAEGRTLNAVISEALEVAVAAGDEGSQLRARARAAGLLVVPPAPHLAHVGSSSRSAAIASTRGAGQAVSTALAAERDTR